MHIKRAYLRISVKTIGIPFNLPSHGKFTGVERYLIELVRAMMKLPLPEGVRFELYSAQPITVLGEFPQGWSNIIVPWNFKGWTHIRMSLYFLRHAPDVLFVPVHEIPFYTGKSKIVATVHDIAFAIVPEVYPEKDVKRQMWAITRLLKRAEHILTVSQSTKDDLMRVMQVPSERMTVTQLASTSELMPPSDEELQKILTSYRLGQKQYLLYVGRLEHKKGILELLRVFDEYKKSQGVGDPLHLVMIGKYGYGEADIRRELAALNRADIHVLGFVEDSTMAALLAAARAFIFPTRYEGFGIPLLEAMQFDLPILTTDLPITREVAGAAALYARAGDIGEWVVILRQLLRDPEVEQMLVEVGRAQRQKFAWEKTARATLAAITGV